MNGVLTAIDRLGNALLKAEGEIARLTTENEMLRIQLAKGNSDDDKGTGSGNGTSESRDGQNDGVRSAEPVQ